MAPRRFSELKADLQGISANVLTQRLTELEARGLVRKTRLPPPASVQVYEATDWGLEAMPSSLRSAAGRRAARCHDPTLPMSHVSMIMSLQTLISPELAEGSTRGSASGSARPAMSPRSATAALDVERRRRSRIAT